MEGLNRVKTCYRCLPLPQVHEIKKEDCFQLGKFMKLITLRLVCGFLPFPLSSPLILQVTDCLCFRRKPTFLKKLCCLDFLPTFN